MAPPPKPQPLTRSEKARRIVWDKDGSIKRIDENTYQVKSQSGNGSYVVLSTEFGWKCACADHQYRHVKCKHIIAIEYSQELRHEVESVVVRTVKPVDNLSCIVCKSARVIKFAIRKNKYGNVQRYKCNDCGKRFSFNIGFEKMHATPQIITTAMQLYFSGESLRNVQNFVKLQGLQISHVAVYKWIKKYTGLMQKYLDRITPRLSDTWRTDEIFLKVKGSTKYLYAIMDDETRFWIAQQVADTKYTYDVRPMFQEAREVAGKKPIVLISDGARNFHQAYLKEYRTLERETKHIRHIHLEGDHHNNKMERLNGEFRDREKVMRCVKKKDSVVLKGYQMYHNYFRKHEGLAGKTPADIAGIKIEGRNKWITVIQNASKLAN
jgi:transposase-like protein